MISREELVQRINHYAQSRGLEIVKQLGFGVHGTVFATRCHPSADSTIVHSAVKAHHREADYLRERDVYLRLQQEEVKNIGRHAVPQLLAHDDSLLILEMTIVTRPYVLDFAGAFLDYKPDFDPEVLADWHAEKREQFGKRWTEVQAILRAFEELGIFIIDVNPNNIAAD